jgi:hypothetical protein
VGTDGFWKAQSRTKTSSMTSTRQDRKDLPDMTRIEQDLL